MDIGRAFTFVGDDPKWVQKLLIGGGLFLLGYLTSIILIGIPIFLIVLGYLVQVTRNVIGGQDRPLPEWNDWGACCATVSSRSSPPSSSSCRSS